MLRAKITCMTPPAMADASEKIRAQIPCLPRWREARTVAAYAPLPGEPDLRPLDWADAMRLLLPRIEGDNLVFHHVTRPADLRPGAFGVPEPDPASCPVADASVADIIIVPGLGFTVGGARIGRGRGYYDRFLASLPPRVLRVGVCFREQIVAELPREPHDEAVDIVLAAQD